MPRDGGDRRGLGVCSLKQARYVQRSRVRRLVLYKKPRLGAAPG